MVWERKDQCCGCGACKSACPVNAIAMAEDEEGFLYPSIDEGRCVHCGACRRVCAHPLHAAVGAGPLRAYAAALESDERLMSSASGGAFSALAEAVLGEKGTVVGSALEFDDWGIVQVRHIMIGDPEQLTRLQGSKYVQSDTFDIFLPVREALRAGKTVLFSGLPCQVAAVKRFAGDSGRLLTVDLICHGVPPLRMFRDWLAHLQRGGRRIRAFSFRDKVSGWEQVAKCCFQDREEKWLPAYQCAYYAYFARSVIFRDCCYRCPYACLDRVGDLTLGDFWGIELSHPEWLGLGAGRFDSRKGISCVLVNTPAGAGLLERAKGLTLRETSVESVAKRNAQLRQPSRPGSDRAAALAAYRKGGYRGLERRYRRELGLARWGYYQVKARIPNSLKRRIKDLLIRKYL